MLAVYTELEATVFEELSPVEFVKCRRDGEFWQLLDVRETWEIELARVADALRIPMRNIVERLGELDTERPIAVLCHTGIRSALVAGYLARSGFGRVANIRGGIDAWSVDVDPGIPRY